MNPWLLFVLIIPYRQTASYLTIKTDVLMFWKASEACEKMASLTDSSFQVRLYGFRDKPDYQSLEMVELRCEPVPPIPPKYSVVAIEPEK